MVRVVFVLRRSAIIFAPSTSRMFPPKLQTRIKRMRQGVLTVGRGDKAAYLSSNNVELPLRASARCFAPSAPMLLSCKLQTGIDQTRQRVLTVAKGRRAAYSSCTNVEFVFRASARCLAPSAPSSLYPKLRARADRRRQGVLTAGEGRKAAHLTLARVVFVLRRSAMLCAPSALRPL